MTIKEYERASRAYKNYEHCKICCDKLKKIDLDKIIFCDTKCENNDVNVCHKEFTKKTFYESDEKLVKLLLKTARDFYKKEYEKAEKNLQQELKGVELK